MQLVKTTYGRRTPYSPQGYASKSRQYEAGFVNVGIIVFEKLLFLLCGPLSERVLKVKGGILAADHKANLSTWVSGDIGVCVLDVGEDIAAVLEDRNDEVEVDEVVLTCVSKLVI
jgi:hypothetical protein